jgi:hypothetical protein
MQVMRVPDRILPAPGRGDLPEPVRLRRMIGPSVILAGLSIGSGEFVLWPRLTAEWGFALFWACWVGVTIQFFLNMEIERWTLATGESACRGSGRAGRPERRRSCPGNSAFPSRAPQSSGSSRVA